MALAKTPEGYLEIPTGRVRDPYSPSTGVAAYGQPGGGTEITTEFPIDAGGLPLNLFRGDDGQAPVPGLL